MASSAAFNTDKNASVDTIHDVATTPASDAPYVIQVDAVSLPPSHAPAAAAYSVKHKQYLAPAHAVSPPPAVVLLQSTAAASEWQVSLFGCFWTPAHCCLSFWCPCVSAGYAAHWIGWSGALVGLFIFATCATEVVFGYGPSEEGGAWFSFDNSSNDMFAFNMESWIPVTTWDYLSYVCFLAFVAATTLLRRAVRTFDRIPGSTINDFCASFWCSCCVLSQLSSHTERVKPLRSANASTLPAYNAA